RPLRALRLERCPGLGRPATPRNRRHPRRLSIPPLSRPRAIVSQAEGNPPCINPEQHQERTVWSNPPGCQEGGPKAALSLKLILQPPQTQPSSKRQRPES